MHTHNFYDVTTWAQEHQLDAFADIGAVINAIIADIKQRQNVKDVNNGGKPGATIFISAGDYHLHTQALIDLSYLKIVGEGHGFTSSSIRFNTTPEEIKKWHEVWPGGSRIINELPGNQQDEAQGAAILVKREGNPRLSSIEFSNFCIDGLHFVADATGRPDVENTYENGKTGIYIASASDSTRISEMGVVYCEHGITIYDADALNIYNNFIAECGNCIELRGSGQASKISNNLIGAGYKGYSIYACNFGGLLIADNNVFPRGKSSIHLSNVNRSNISANRLHSFYPGMLILDQGSSENLVGSNHLLRDHEPWAPMQDYDNGLSDDFGMVVIAGNNNSVIGNHISQCIEQQYLKFPAECQERYPVAIKIQEGSGNYIAINHIVGTTTTTQNTQEALASACFNTQVEALLSTKQLQKLKMLHVLVEANAQGNTILDCGTASELAVDGTTNTVRALP